MSETVTLPNDLLPLTPAVFHILLALADGEKHGYGIMQEVNGNILDFPIPTASNGALREIVPSGPVVA